MKVEGSFVHAKPLMKLDILLTSYSLQDNILVLKHKSDLTTLNTSYAGITFQQIIYHELKVDKWTKYTTNKNFI